MANLSIKNILTEINLHPCQEAVDIGGRELEKRGYHLVYDTYIEEFIAVA